MSDQNTPTGDAGGPGPVEPPFPPLPPPPPRTDVPPRRGGGSILFGALIGVAAMLGQFGLVTLTGSGSLPPGLSQAVSVLAGILPFALVVVGIVLSVMSNTRRTGAGILISIGMAILIVGGLCVAMLASYTIGG